MRRTVASSQSRVASRIVLYLLLATCYLLLLFADTTGDLRPTADGATEQWQNNANTACSTVDCYTEVNEASGANCTTTPGDGTSRG